MGNQQFLPLGTSDFSALRAFKQIYVDKTKFVYDLARLRGKFFLARPPRFGKSLLLSTFESLFKYGIRDFHGLALENLWKEDKTYLAVRLDFSYVQTFDTIEEFLSRFESFLMSRFGCLGFTYVNDGTLLLSQLSAWLKTLPLNSLVVLIDNCEAPLASSLEDPKLFEKVQGILETFYAVLEANDAAMRFLFVTGVAYFYKFSSISDRPTLIDISLNPYFGTLTGFTREELFDFFGPYLDTASKQTANSKEALVQKLQDNYAGYCFDEWAQQKVFDPWPVLNFLKKPELGFKDYSMEAKKESSIARQFCTIAKNQKLSSQATSLQLIDLNNHTNINNISTSALLVQTGYLTIKRTEFGTAFLGAPNRQVEAAMHRETFFN